MYQLFPCRLLFSSTTAAFVNSRWPTISVGMVFSCFFFFLVLLQPPVLGRLTVTPRNQVTSIGSRVTFHCETNITKRLTWSHTPVGKQLSLDVDINNRHSVNSTNSSIYRFTIESVTLEDAGVHAWSDNDGFGTPFGIDLVVIRSGLSCMTNATTDGVTASDAISMVCSVTYRGNMKAVGKWIDPVGTMTNASKGDVVDISDGKEFRKLTTADVNIGRRQVHRFLLAFKARDKDPRMFAVNDIDESYSWTSPEMNVMFPASNVRLNVTGEGDVIVYLGETVTCSADGNPEVQYHWVEIDLKTGTERDIGAGPLLTLSVSGRHKLKCIAQNIIRSKIYRSSKIIHLNVVPRTQSTSSQPVDPRIGDRRTFGVTYTGVDRSFAKTESSRNLDTLSTASLVNPEYSPDTGAETKRMKLLDETTLFFLTVALGSILLAAIVVLVVWLIIRRKTKRGRRAAELASKEHYVTLASSGERQHADDEHGCHRESFSGYNNDRKSDIYEEIHDSEVIDESLQRKEVYLKEPWPMSSLSTPRFEDIADEEITTMESSYITCPATLLVS